MQLAEPAKREVEQVALREIDLILLVHRCRWVSRLRMDSSRNGIPSMQIRSSSRRRCKITCSALYQISAVSTSQIQANSQPEAFLVNRPELESWGSNENFLSSTCVRKSIWVSITSCLRRCSSFPIPQRLLKKSFWRCTFDLACRHRKRGPRASVAKVLIVAAAFMSDIVTMFSYHVAFTHPPRR